MYRAGQVESFVPIPMQWIASKLVSLPDYKKTDVPLSKADLDRFDKFKESAYKCGVQILFTCVIFFVGWQAEWFWDPKKCFSDCNAIPCDTQIPSPGEKFIYRLELAFYTQAIPMVFLWETKRKDMWELFAHHVATVILIGYSYYLKYGWVQGYACMYISVCVVFGHDFLVVD